MPGVKHDLYVYHSTTSASNNAAAGISTTHSDMPVPVFIRIGRIHPTCAIRLENGANGLTSGMLM